MADKNNNDERLNNLIEAITAIASLDFSKKLAISENQDLLDTVSLGFNMLSEALEDTVVSKERLATSEKKYKALFSKANDVIILVRDAKVIDFNEKTIEIFGYSAKELKGIPIVKLVPDFQENGQASWELIKEMAKEALEKGSSLRIFQNIKKDKTLFQAEVNVGWVELSEITYFQVIIRDVSERRKAEIALKKSVAKFKALFEFAPNAMLIAQGSNFIEVNPAFEEMFGYRQEELATLNLEILTHPKDRKLHLTSNKKVKKENLPKFSLEKRYRRKDGTVFHGFVNVSIIKEVEEHIKNYHIVQIIDISEQKRAAKQIQTHLNELEKINKELDQFAYVVSHDLKAPLRGITAIANFIEEDIEDENYEDIPENLELLKGRITRMGNLITGILEFSRAGKINESEENLDFNLVLQEVIEMLAPPDSVKINIKASLPTICVAKISIQQTFQNLLSNAIKYNDKKACKITIDYKLDKEQHLFMIKDNGPGIKREFHQKIFEIFQTLQPRDRVESTGVGLSIVRKRIENLGGKIWVKSEVGKGATFLFSLPMTERIPKTKTPQFKVAY